MSAERMETIATAIPGSKKDQIKQLLKANCTPSQVARAVGCDVSFISQLLMDEEFAGEVTVHRIKILAEQNAVDSTYDRLEKKLVEGLEMKLDQGVAFLKMDVILRAIQTVNNAKRRGAANGETLAPPSNIVQLIMPTVIVKQFQTNLDNEVIRVGETDLISMSSKGIMERLAITNNIKIATENAQKSSSKGETYEAHAENKIYRTAKSGSEEERRIERATISAEQI
jgi:hypothetical protein